MAECAGAPQARGTPLLMKVNDTADNARSSLARMLAVVDLFSAAAPLWTVERIAARLGYTRATAYRYVGGLCEAGFLSRIAQGAYALGPRIVELDREMRLGDPLLRGAERVMPALLRPDFGQLALLCSLFRDRVLCIHQLGRDRALTLSYSRGRPMPLFRGATSKAILAYLPDRRLARLFQNHRRQIREAGLGRTRAEFMQSLRAIRRQGYSVTRAEVDAGVVGVAVPLFGAERGVIGSLSVVFPAARFPQRRLETLVARLRRAADSMHAALKRRAAPGIQPRRLSQSPI